MVSDTDRAALDVVLRSLPTRRGVAIMVSDDGQIESGALGLNDGEVMLACWSIAVQIASHTPEGIGIFERMLKETMKAEPASKPRLYVAKGTL